MVFVFMDKCKLLVLVFLVYINVVQANKYSEVGLPVTQIFSIKEHGGSDQNWALTQAENGLIYSGTGTGIIEWDGEKWHLYNTPNNSRVRSISHWRDGHIYVGTIDDLGVYQPNALGKLQFTSLVKDWTLEQRQFGEVWSTAANKDGVMFVTNIRKQTVEHPFGTIKMWMGATHYLTKRLKNVSTETNLHVLAYNLKRMMSIKGTIGLMKLIRQ